MDVDMDMNMDMATCARTGIPRGRLHSLCATYVRLRRSHDDHVIDLGAPRVCSVCHEVMRVRRPVRWSRGALDRRPPLPTREVPLALVLVMRVEEAVHVARVVAGRAMGRAVSGAVGRALGSCCAHTGTGVRSSIRRRGGIAI